MKDDKILDLLTKYRNNVYTSSELNKHFNEIAVNNDEQFYYYNYKLLEQVPIDSCKYWLLIGRIFNRQKKYKLSQDAYYLSFDINPKCDNNQLINSLIYTFRQLDNHAATKALYLERLKQNRKDTSALEKLGNSCFKHEEYFEAMIYYQRFLKYNPNDKTKQELLRQASAKATIQENQYTALINALSHDFTGNS